MSTTGLMSFTSSKIKVYKGLVGPIDKLRGGPPLYACPTHVTTFKDRNKKSQEFYNFRMRPANGSWANTLLLPDNPLLAEGLKFHNALEAGEVKVGDESDDSAGTDNIPF